MAMIVLVTLIWVEELNLNSLSQRQPAVKCENYKTQCHNMKIILNTQVLEWKVCISDHKNVWSFFDWLKLSGFYLFSRKQWLSEVGSPDSKIEKAEFKDEKDINKLDFENFVVKDY